MSDQAFSAHLPEKPPADTADHPATNEHYSAKNMSRFLIVFASLTLISCHADVEELTRLHGKTEAAAIAELGAPTYSNVMTLKKGVTLPELYIEIHNTYNPTDPSSEGVEIKELRWDRSGFTEAVFMHRPEGVWTVLESCRWKDGVAF